MSFSIVFLVFVSSLLHVAWNMIGKRGTPSAAFFMGTAASGVVLFLPVYFRIFPPSMVPPGVWIYVISAGFFQTVYYIGLGSGYRFGDLSYVYPLARAMPVIIIPIISRILKISFILSTINLIGMILVFTGCVLLPLEKRKWKDILRNYISGASLFALLAAAGTTGYTIVDSVGVQLLKSLSVDSISESGILAAVFYLAYEMLFTFMFILMYVLLSKKERNFAVDIWRESRLSTFMSGMIILSAYGIIIITYTMFENVSYIAAFRQMSIPIGVIAGILILKEKQSIGKITGSALIFTGLILVYL